MYILPPSISKKIEGYRWQNFTPPAAGKSRRFRGLICHRRSHFFASYANRAACKECQLKSKCTISAFRRVLRYVDEAILERMAERLAARPELLDARRESVEHPFGSIKQWMGQGAFLTRRLENVRGEFSITALAYNIRRAISLVGVPALIAAARA